MGNTINQIISLKIRSNLLLTIFHSFLIIKPSYFNLGDDWYLAELPLPIKMLEALGVLKKIN